MKTHYSGKHIYEVGCGIGNTASMLAKAGMNVTAIDLEPRTESEFDVIKADSTEYAFEKGSVLMFCRPCHDHDFVRNTILRGLTCGVRAIVYVGLQRNVRADFWGYYKKFSKRRIANIGHADERIWEMRVGRLQADACLRRGAIPPLSD
jgi:SAM-dependent methyltransferase